MPGEKTNETTRRTGGEAKKNRHVTGGKSMLAWIDCILHFSQAEDPDLSTFDPKVSMVNLNKSSTVCG
ncbi:hypothetical protein B6I87_02030 [Klebsiella quasipneumoniae]|nr:hypothetical protein BME39_11805 [Klebsiella quasipneumoniae subsp. similipneumoniae]PLF15201.1 hypothetical protein B6I87_02030 [Klebsiella quasipneumoniae]